MYIIMAIDAIFYLVHCDGCFHMYAISSNLFQLDMKELLNFMGLLFGLAIYMYILVTAFLRNFK